MLLQLSWVSLSSIPGEELDFLIFQRSSWGHFALAIVDWHDRPDMLKFEDRKENWQFPVGLLPGSFQTRFQWKSVGMPPQLCPNRVIAPGTELCRNATQYLSYEVRSFPVEGHFLLNTDQPAWLSCWIVKDNIRNCRNCQKIWAWDTLEV